MAATVAARLSFQALSPISATLAIRVLSHLGYIQFSALLRSFYQLWDISPEPGCRSAFCRSQSQQAALPSRARGLHDRGANPGYFLSRRVEALWRGAGRR